MVNAILWILRTGAPWRDLSADAGVCWKTAASRFYRWTASGTWQKVLSELQRDADQDGAIDWSKHFVDGSSIALISTPQVLEAAARKTRRSAGTAGVFTSKTHVKAEGYGKLLTFVVTPGQRNRAAVFEHLLDAVEERMVSDLSEEERSKLLAMLRRCSAALRVEGSA